MRAILQPFQKTHTDIRGELCQIVVQIMQLKLSLEFVQNVACPVKALKIKPFIIRYAFQKIQGLV